MSVPFRDPTPLSAPADCASLRGGIAKNDASGDNGQ